MHVLDQLAWPAIWIGCNTFENPSCICCLCWSGWGYKPCRGAASWRSWPCTWGQVSLRSAEGDTHSSPSLDSVSGNQHTVWNLHSSSLQRLLTLPPPMMIADYTHWLGLPRCKHFMSWIRTLVDCKSAHMAQYSQAPSQLHSWWTDVGAGWPPLLAEILHEISIYCRDTCSIV